MTQMTLKSSWQFARTVVCGTTLSLLGACRGEMSPGPCYHEFKSPILEFESATIAGSGASIATLRILGVSYRGADLDLADLAAGPSFGLTLEDNVLICTVPCGLGTMDGRYIVSVSGDGVLSQSVIVDARYEHEWGNCPSFSEGPTGVSLVFSEQ